MSQEQMKPSVVEVDFRARPGSKVAVLDDSDSSSHKLDIKLQFIGEQPYLFNESSAHDLPGALSSGDFFALIIGTLPEQSIHNHLRLLADRNIGIPVIIASNHFRAELLDQDLRPRVIASFSRPVQYEKLVEALNLARRQSGLESQDFESVIASEAGSPLFRGLVGDSLAMQQLREVIKRLEGQSVTVLLTGEEGSGMEIVARNLHFGSGRKGKHFVAVNCAAMTADTAVVDLFGCEAGHSGTGIARTGLLEKAHNGTIYLDRVEELPLEAQARLVSFMETGVCVPAGSQRARKVDVRLIASACSTLKEPIARKTFRADLFYLLNVFPITMPALRQRSEDIPDLINELVSRLQHLQRAPVSFDQQALQSLRQHDWPGNIRELANLVERLSIIKANDTVTLDDLPSEYRHTGQEEARVEAYEPVAGEADSTSGTDMEHTAEEREGAPEYFISVDGELTNSQLGDVLRRFEKSMVEVALDDTLFMTSIAAERLAITEEELAEKRNRLAV